MRIRKTVLMVEGKDDKYVVENICGRQNLGKISEVKHYDGKESMIDSIKVRLKESGVTSLGIMLDADTNLKASWDAVSFRLSESGYESIPNNPEPTGTIVFPPSPSLLPKVGIWLMPDNSIPGILENFLQFLIPENDVLLSHVKKSIQSIPPEQKNFSKLKEPKAQIHTWLAWQEEPGKPYGQAISARYLDPSLPAASDFIIWLRRTFFE